MFLEIDIFPEEGRTVARCEALRISDHGEDENQALRNLSKTLTLYFLSCIRRETIWRILDKAQIAYEVIRPHMQSSEEVLVPAPVLLKKAA